MTEMSRECACVAGGRLGGSGFPQLLLVADSKQVRWCMGNVLRAFRIASTELPRMSSKHSERGRKE